MKIVMKVLLSIGITLAIIIAMLGIAFGVVVNLTPEKLGFADVEIVNGQSLNDLGLGGIKIKDIYHYIKDLKNVDESDIVKNGFNKNTDGAHASENLEGSTVCNEDGEIDYSKIINGPIYYDQNKVVLYDDSTLAFIFNSMVKQTTQIEREQADGGEQDAINESLEFVQELNLNVDEITITKGDEDTKAHLRLVGSIDLTDAKKEIKDEIKVGSGLIPDKVYIVCYLDIQANEEGQIITSAKSIKINDQSSAISDAIFKALASISEIEVQDGEDPSAFVCKEIGKAFSTIIYNLGKVGVSNNQFITPTFTYGNEGIMNARLSIVTQIQPLIPIDPFEPIHIDPTIIVP